MAKFEISQTTGSSHKHKSDMSKGRICIGIIVILLAVVSAVLAYFIWKNVTLSDEVSALKKEISKLNQKCDTDDCDGEWYNGTFPPGFIWASATSSYQIEGAWDTDGKGESIWDRFVHTPGHIEDNHTGDVACDSYNKYNDDVALLVNLGVSHYRFSIAWTRIQPTGQDATPNALGVQYYNNLINALLTAGIQPMVTLYHWDLPQGLEDQGGWLNDTLIVPAFADYSRICFQEFGDRVKYWITLNEPWIVAYLGYGIGAFAPGVNGTGDLVYIVGHNLIRAHAESYHVYNDQFRETQNGQIGITLNSNWLEPRNRSVAADIDAAERALEFDLGWFANPIFVNGDYPDVMKSRIGEKSSQQGFNQSRLPTFTTEEKQRNYGTSDFFGLNHYTTSLAFTDNKPLFPPHFDNDKDISTEVDPDWPTSGSSWLFVAPFGMRSLLDYIDRKYGHPQIIVTENGVSDRTATLDDEHRVFYFRHYINNALQAIDLDGVNLIGYTAWSLIDNFEWGTGYNEKFGLCHVDFNDAERPRTFKISANEYKKIVADNGFPA